MAKHDALPSIENQQMAMPSAQWNMLRIGSRRGRIAEQLRRELDRQSLRAVQNHRDLT
jgi:predicted AAA+ superfamily ATPase